MLSDLWISHLISNLPVDENIKNSQCDGWNERANPTWEDDVAEVEDHSEVALVLKDSAIPSEEGKEADQPHQPANRDREFDNLWSYVLTVVKWVADRNVTIERHRNEGWNRHGKERRQEWEEKQAQRSISRLSSEALKLDEKKISFYAKQARLSGIVINNLFKKLFQMKIEIWSTPVPGSILILTVYKLQGIPINPVIKSAVATDMM